MFHRKRAIQRMLVGLVSVALLTSPVYAIELEHPAAEASQQQESVQPQKTKPDAYSAYLAANAAADQPQQTLRIEAKELLSHATETGSIGKWDDNLRSNGAIVYDQDIVKVTYGITVETAGLYHLGMEYMSLDEIIREVEVSVEINGESPFQQASSIKLPKHYINAKPVTQDNRGNDMRPSTVVDKCWIQQTFSDAGGIIGEYSFLFREGRNGITLTFHTGKIAIGSLQLSNAPALPSYEKYIASRNSAASEYSDIVEGESARYRSDAVICLNYDRSGPNVTPSDPVALKLNTIGGTGWSDPNQYVGWTVKVPEDGFYRLQLRYRQNGARGRSVYRKLFINGEIPFAEAQALPFAFKDSWQTAYLGGNDPYLFYFKKGENELRLETTTGAFAPTIEKANELSEMLREVYRDLIMVTGINPDANRDYMLTTEIPDLINRFKILIKKLDEIEQVMKVIDGDDLSNDAATIRTLRVQLNGFIDSPDSIAMRVSRFQSNISSFSDFSATLKKQPLEIDKIAISTPDQQPIISDTGAGEMLSYHVKAFFSSFVNDYSSVGDIKSKDDSIEVWVDYVSGSIGRDHAQTIMQVTDSLFTPQEHVSVNIKLVQQALAPAILSGIGPDVAMYVGTSEPVNLAARGGLLDVHNMPGFEELRGEFQKGAFTPFEYNGGVYAVPFTESFPVLFCRTDILKDLGIAPPTTWDEFYEALAVIQKNNMTVGVPNASGGAMSTDNTIYAMLLYQNGGKYFNADMSKTRFDDELAVNAFKQWTDLFKNYGLSFQYSFYQRFRLGDMPIAIEGYSMYNMLTVAAPEITGLWDIYPLPGVKNKNGTINNTAVAAGACTVILSDTQKAESAWKYVKWLSSTKAQTQISLELEALLGPTGRMTPANVKAFDNLPWDKSASDTIKAQWKSVTFLPQIPGNYYVERNLTNAFRKTVFYKRNYREALLEYNREMNLEISRKRTEFGLATADK